MTGHEVISAFMDDEPFDARGLGEALADPAGRELLIDLIALRHLVQPDESGWGAAPRAGSDPVKRRWPRWLAAAAAVVLSAGAGFAVGHRTAPRVEIASAAAPAPTRVIELKPGVEWHETGGGH